MFIDPSVSREEKEKLLKNSRDMFQKEEDIINILNNSDMKFSDVFNRVFGFDVPEMRDGTPENKESIKKLNTYMTGMVGEEDE